MSGIQRDEQGRRIVKTILCPTPYCYGSQDIVEAPESPIGTLTVGGCLCGYLADEVDFELWTLREKARV